MITCVRALWRQLWAFSCIGFLELVSNTSSWNLLSTHSAPSSVLCAISELHGNTLRWVLLLASFYSWWNESLKMLSDFSQSQLMGDKQFSEHGVGKRANQEVIRREGWFSVDYPERSPGRHRVGLRLQWGNGHLWVTHQVYLVQTHQPGQWSECSNWQPFPLLLVGRFLLCDPHHSILISDVALATKSCSLGPDCHLI